MKYIVIAFYTLFFSLFSCVKAQDDGPKFLPQKGQVSLSLSPGFAIIGREGSLFKNEAYVGYNLSRHLQLGAFAGWHQGFGIFANEARWRYGAFGTVYTHPVGEWDWFEHLLKYDPAKNRILHKFAFFAHGAFGRSAFDGNNFPFTSGTVLPFNQYGEVGLGLYFAFSRIFGLWTLNSLPIAVTRQGSWVFETIAIGTQVGFQYNFGFDAKAEGGSPSMFRRPMRIPPDTSSRKPNQEAQFDPYWTLGTSFQPVPNFDEINYPPGTMFWEYDWRQIVAYTFHPNWRVGLENVLIWTRSPVRGNDNFRVSGFFVDYDLVGRSPHRLYVSTGLAGGNYCPCGDDDPFRRRGTVYARYGAGIEYAFSRRFGVDAGFAVHQPLGVGSTLKPYGITMLILGANIYLGRGKWPSQQPN